MYANKQQKQNDAVDGDFYEWREEQDAEDDEEDGEPCKGDKTELHYGVQRAKFYKCTVNSRRYGREH